MYYSWSAAGAGSYDAVEVAGNTTSTLVPVHPWLRYSFTVKARNQIGQSDDAELVYCTTPQTAPFEHPRNVCTQTRLSNQLAIVWQVRTFTLKFLHYTSVSISYVRMKYCAHYNCVFTGRKRSCKPCTSYCRKPSVRPSVSPSHAGTE